MPVAEEVQILAVTARPLLDPAPGTVVEQEALRIVDQVPTLARDQALPQIQLLAGVHMHAAAIAVQRPRRPLQVARLGHARVPVEGGLEALRADRQVVRIESAAAKRVDEAQRRGVDVQLAVTGGVGERRHLLFAIDKHLRRRVDEVAVRRPFHADDSRRQHGEAHVATLDYRRRVGLTVHDRLRVARRHRHRQRQRRQPEDQADTSVSFHRLPRHVDSMGFA